MRKPRSYPMLVSIAILTVGLLSAERALAERCAKPHEQTALNARALQIELMVAALSCRHQALYNGFVRKFRGQLAEQGRSLRSFFERQHGAQGRKNLNAFITQLANGASRRSYNERVAFCVRASALFDQLLNSKPANFDVLLESAAFTRDHDIPSCGDMTNAHGKSIGYNDTRSDGTSSSSLVGPKR